MPIEVEQPPNTTTQSLNLERDNANSREARIKEVAKEMSEAQKLMDPLDEAPKKGAADPREGDQPKVAEAKGVSEPEKAPEKVEEAPKGIAASFEKLAKEKAELRKRSDAVKAFEEISQNLDPMSLKTLMRAKASGDPLAALAALGFSYSDVANRMLDTRARPKEAPPAAAEPPKSALPPEFDEVRQELAELRQDRTRRMEVEALQNIEKALGDKFPLTKKLKAAPMVKKYIEDFYARTGELPGDTFDETVALAAEAVEQRYKAEAEKWRSVLSENLTVSEAEPMLKQPVTSERPPGPVSSGRTLSNAIPQTGVKAEPTDRAGRIKSLIDDPNIQW